MTLDEQIRRLSDERARRLTEQDAEQRANAAFEVFILVLMLVIAAVLAWVGLRDIPAAWVA